MLSPRADGSRPTLSNFGCFIPRPNGESGSIASMLSPRFMEPEQKPKPQNPMKKALDSRGGVVKGRDGFEIFFGTNDAKKQPARRRATAETGSITAPARKIEQVDANAGATQTAQPSSQSAVTEQKRPAGVPKLQLGPSRLGESMTSTKDNTSSSASATKTTQQGRQRRMTAPPAASTRSTEAAAESQHPIAAVSSLATAGWGGLAAWASATADAANAVVEAAVDAAAPAVASTAGAPRGFSGISITSPRGFGEAFRSPRGEAAAKQAPAFAAGARSPRSERRSAAEKAAQAAEKLSTPRGVPVFSLSGAPRYAPAVPTGVESYSIADDEAETSLELEPAPVAAMQGEEPAAGAALASDANGGEAARSDENVVARSDENVESPQVATAALPAAAAPAPFVPAPADAASAAAARMKVPALALGFAKAS